MSVRRPAIDADRGTPAGSRTKTGAPVNVTVFVSDASVVEVTEKVAVGVNQPFATSAAVTRCRGVEQVYAAPAARVRNRQLGAVGGRKPESNEPETGTDEVVTFDVEATENVYATGSPTAYGFVTTSRAAADPVIVRPT